MRRIIFITTAAFIMCTCLTACGNKKESAAYLEPGNTEAVVMEEAQEADSETSSGQSDENLMSRLIAEQTFKVNLEGWGDVVFASFAPKGSMDVEFKLMRDQETVYEFPGVYAGNSLYGEQFLQVAAVAFKDYNDDKKTDVIVINEYEQTEDGFRWYAPRVYIQQSDGNAYVLDELLAEYLLKNHYTDSIASVMAAKESYKDYADSLDGSHSLDSQLAVIAENMEVWNAEPEYADDAYQYAITNLDLDDKWEIMVSHMGGTGSYTYTHLYEVNESFDGLMEWQSSYKEGDSQLDLMVDTATVYHPTAEDIYYYVFTDFLKESPVRYVQRIGALVIEENMVSEQPLAYRLEEYDEQGTGTITCTDEDGREITEEEYLQTDERIYDGMNQYTVTFGWQDISELKNLDTEQLKLLLEQSYDEFEVDVK
ncbi:MAG: hypothetical protein KH452_00220 [Clostridiales bacterium]|nr:hypothetical protein [Clostridiales bacterium]